MFGLPFSTLCEATQKKTHDVTTFVCVCLTRTNGRREVQTHTHTHLKVWHANRTKGSSCPQSARSSRSRSPRGNAKLCTRSIFLRVVVSFCRLGAIDCGFCLCERSSAGQTWIGCQDCINKQICYISLRLNSFRDNTRCALVLMSTEREREAAALLLLARFDLVSRVPFRSGKCQRLSDSSLPSKKNGGDKGFFTVR